MPDDLRDGPALISYTLFKLSSEAVCGGVGGLETGSRADATPASGVLDPEALAGPPTGIANVNAD
jgi:hypothetical protein